MKRKTFETKDIANCESNASRCWQAAKSNGATCFGFVKESIKNPRPEKILDEDFLSDTTFSFIIEEMSPSQVKRKFNSLTGLDMLVGTNERYILLTIGS